MVGDTPKGRLLPREVLLTERKKQGLTQERVVHLIHQRWKETKPLKLSASKLSRMENGTVEITASILQPWAQVLNLSFNQVFLGGWDTTIQGAAPPKISPKHWEMLTKLNTTGQNTVYRMIEELYNYSKDNNILK